MAKSTFSKSHIFNRLFVCLPEATHDCRLGSPAAVASGRFRLPDAPRWDAVAAALQRLLLMRAVLALERAKQRERVEIYGKHMDLWDVIGVMMIF